MSVISVSVLVVIGRIENVWCVRALSLLRISIPFMRYERLLVVVVLPAFAIGIDYNYTEHTHTFCVSNMALW